MNKFRPIARSLGPEIRTLLMLMAPDREDKNLVDPEDLQLLNGQLLLNLAGQHGLTYQTLQFSRANPDLFTQEQLEMLARRGKQNAVRALLQLNELIRIGSHLNKHGLPYVCIKGPQLSHMLYGESAMKASVDLDIMLVHATDLQVFCRTLNDLGYSISDLDNRSWLNRQLFLLGKREVHFFNPAKNLCIDLHVSPGANLHLARKTFADFFSDRQLYSLKHTEVWVLPPEKYLVYLCYHGSLHQYSRLGWLADVRRFIRLTHQGMDYRKVLWIARRMNTGRSLCLSFSLLNRLYQDTIPACIAQETEEDPCVPSLTEKCLQIISTGPRYDVTLQGRLIRMWFLFRLSEGLLSKTDLLFSILFRHLIRLLGVIK